MAKRVIEKTGMRKQSTMKRASKTSTALSDLLKAHDGYGGVVCRIYLQSHRSRVLGVGPQRGRAATLFPRACPTSSIRGKSCRRCTQRPRGPRAGRRCWEYVLSFLYGDSGGFYGGFSSSAQRGYICIAAVSFVYCFEKNGLFERHKGGWR